jgi:hypothetical protein
VTPRQRRRRLSGLGLLAGVTGGSLLHGGPNLLLVALLVGAAGLVAYQIWRPWAGARCWVRVRYHSATPPDPAAVQEGLLALLDREALVVRWIREPEGIGLWLEIPTRRTAALEPALGEALPELRLEPGPAPSLPPEMAVADVRIAGEPAADEDLRTAPLWAQLAATDPPAEMRLVLLGAQAGALLGAGPGVPPAPFRRIRWLPAAPAWTQVRTWVLAHYPWAAPWPVPGHLPPLPLPATTDPALAPLDSRCAYQLPPLPAPVPPDPYLELGISTVTGGPLRVSLTADGITPPPIWQGHFLSLGTGPQRYRPLEALAAQARALDAPLVALDPEHRLLPTMQTILLDPGIQPAWINRQHPRNSLRFNLLAVAPTPAPGYTPEGGALHLALTSALPLFEEFLARLGVAPWSTITGGVFVHDLTVVLLLAHHRARLSGARPRPVPTPATIYQHLQTGADLRPLLDAEYQAWQEADLATACGPGATARQTYTTACAALAAALSRWTGNTLTQQQTARDSLCNLLQPLWDAPGFQALWQGTTAPGHYFNTQQAALTLTHLLPADATGRDRVLARWYAEYLVLNLVAAAQARAFAGAPSPPILLLLDDLRAWWHGPLRPTHLRVLGTAGICCAATDTRLPGAPDGDEILQNFATWWLHTLAPADQARTGPYLAAIQSHAGDLPLAHFPADLALLRAMQPEPQAATVRVSFEAAAQGTREVA